MHADKNPNPQGKGVAPLLADWQATRPARAAAKAPGELLLDWFNSALVLSAAFRFRPVQGQDYYLYLRDGAWRLSLIGPDEWGARDAGECLGRCRLRADMTWAIEPQADLAQRRELRQALAALASGFLDALDHDGAADDLLPGYRRDLSYFQRLLATGLGSSLRASLAEAGAATLSARTLRDAGETVLLGAGGQAPPP